MTQTNLITSDAESKVKQIEEGKLQEISSLTAAYNSGTPNSGTTPVPEPLTLSLFGAGLIALGALLWRRRKSA